MKDLTIRAWSWLASRALLRDDRGQTTSEYLMWGAVAVVGITALGSRLFGDVLDGLITSISSALP